MNSPPPPPSRLRRILAGVLLGLLLVQVLCFFVGFLVPSDRILRLWGKGVEERRGIFWPPSRVIKPLGDAMPLTAKVYVEQPDATTHKHTAYYFYPRVVAVTMSDTDYENRYEKWNEPPTREWLLSNGFTYVVNFKEGRLMPVSPPATPVPHGP